MKFSRYNRSVLLVFWPLVLLLLVFWEPITQPGTIFHPDWAPYFEAGRGHGFYRLFVNVGRAPSFMYFLWALLPDRWFHLLFYPLCVFGIWAVMYVFLRDRRFPRVAAMTGALAIGFSGYLLTLVSAGHRGKFEAMLTAVILLLCIDRTVRGGGVWYGVAAGLVVALTLGTQPDVLAVLGLFVAAYAVMACWSQRDSIWAGRRRFGLALVAGVAVLFVVGAPGVRHIRHSFLPWRQEQIEHALMSTGLDGNVDMESALRAQRWEFTTNWSLPPRDMPELILPLFFGTETMDRDAPFWGELGRSLHWEPGAAGFRNFRQHTIYMGLLQVLLALYACICVLTGVNRMRSEYREERRQVIFWCGVAVVALVLSLGRYTPLYRLFIALPLADTVRAPVKFLHVVNLATAILSAYGLAFLLRIAPTGGMSACANGERQSVRWLVVTCGGLALLLAGGVGVTRLAALQLGHYWSSLGFETSSHAAMLQHMVTAIWRSATLAAALAAGGAVLYVRPRWPRIGMLVGIGVCLAVGLDMAVTARRFVHTADLSVHESRNDVVRDISSPVAPRVLDLLTTRHPHDPLRVNMEHYHAGALRLLDAELAGVPGLLNRAGGDLDSLRRLLTVTSTEYVLGRHEQLMSLVGAGRFELVGGYDYANRIVRSTGRRPPQIVLLRVPRVLPRAAWMSSVRVVEPSEAAEVLLSPDFDPWREVLLETDALALTGELESSDGYAVAVAAEVSDWSRWRTVVRNPPLSGGMLLVNEPFHPDWSGRIDGRRTSIMPANAVMMAIRVPAGAERIVLTRQPGLRFLPNAIVAGLLILILAGLSVRGLVFGATESMP